MPARDRPRSDSWGLPGLYMPDRRWPFDFAQRRMDGSEAVVGTDAGQQDGHSLAVLTTTRIDRDEGASSDYIPAIQRDAHVCEVAGHRRISRLAVRGPRSDPGFARKTPAATSGRLDRSMRDPAGADR